jgi:glutamyl-tRNA reductase
MHYLTISFTHRNSTLDIREKLSYPDDEQKHGCLKKLVSQDSINEAMLISTCNRMEVFVSCSDISDATIHIFNLLSKRASLSVEELEARADVFDDSTAIHHLFSVAASLDSLVVGETQIAGQLKDAYRFSSAHGYCSKKITRAMHHAFKAAARVRNATDISSKPVSIASVAVSKLKSIMDSVSGKKVLVIGVGEMSEIAVKHLASSHADVYIMNRTLQNAINLANECGVNVMDIDELPHAINEFEIIFTATSSNEPIITDEIIKPCNFDRYWFDLALPRDISYSKGERINLYQIDDLKTIVENNKGLREDAARQAHSIVGRSVVEFFEWLDTLNIEPIIKEIYTKAYDDALCEAQRVLEKGYIPKEYESEIKKMSKQVVNRFLHDIVKQMRTASDDAKADMISGSMQKIIQEKNKYNLDKQS